MAPYHTMIAILALVGKSISVPTPDAGLPNVLAHHPIAVDGNTTSIQGPDGLYTAHNSTHMAYYGATPASSKRSDGTDLATRDLLEARQGCSATCNGQYTDGQDISGAQNGLRTHFASYPSWSKSVVYV